MTDPIDLGPLPEPKRTGRGWQEYTAEDMRAERQRAYALGRAAAQGEPVASIGTEWQPCVKLPITVHVREQRPGESHVSTREGITPVKPDDLIMRGVAGEEYPIGRDLFKRTYRMGAAPPAAPAPGVAEALRLFMGAAYPVSTDIDPRGYRWSEAYLDAALAAAQKEQSKP